MRRVALALIAAALFSVASRPWGTGYLAIVAFVPLMFALAGERRPLRAALFVALAWTGLALPAFEGMSLVIWWALPALVVVHAIAWGLAGAGYAFLTRSQTTPLWALPLLVTAVEFIASRRYLWSDAAVGLLPYTQADTVFKVLAPWSGTSGVVFVSAAAGCALYWLLKGRPRPAVWTGMALTALVLAPVPGVFDSASSGEVRVGVVQTARDPIDRLLAPYDGALMSSVMGDFERLTRLAAEQGADLVVWGETVLPKVDVAAMRPPSVASALNAAPVVLAGGLERAEEGTYNSAFAWRGSELELVSRKQALVPIVESAYSPGETADPTSLQGARVAAFVCLDSTFGDLARESVRRGADLIVYLTDDSFAGRTATPHVHLATAVIRAAELGRSVMFANESGPSALIGPTGQILARSRAGEPSTVVANLPLLLGTTPYTALGDWLGTLACLGSVVTLLATIARRRNTPPIGG